MLQKVQISDQSDQKFSISQFPGPDYIDRQTGRLTVLGYAF